MLLHVLGRELGQVGAQRDDDLAKAAAGGGGVQVVDELRHVEDDAVPARASP